MQWLLSIFPLLALNVFARFLESLSRIWDSDSRRHLVPRVDRGRNFVRHDLVEVDDCSWGEIDIALSCRSETQHHENDSR